MSNSVNLSLDVTKTGIQNPLIKVRQGDGGFETLHTTVTSNGEPLDLQGWTITFMGTTAGNHKIVDGNVKLIEAPNGIFDYTPSKAWGMDIGEFKIAYFKFVNGDGSASSANFRVSVIEAVDLKQEEAKNYISVVDTTIAEINQRLTDSLANVTQSIVVTSSAASSLSVKVSSTASSAVSKANSAASNASSVASSAVSNVNSVASSAASYIAINDENLVHKTGNETIAGKKTFSAGLAGELTGNAATANVLNVRSVTFTDISVVTADMVTYSGNWLANSSNVNGIPSVGYAVLEVIPALGNKTAGIIRMTSTSGGIIANYIGIVRSGSQLSWVLLSDDSKIVHNTGTETIAGDKTFTGNNTFSGTLKSSNQYLDVKSRIKSVDASGVTSMWFGWQVYWTVRNGYVTYQIRPTSTGTITPGSKSDEALPVEARPLLKVFVPLRWGGQGFSINTDGKLENDTGVNIDPNASWSTAVSATAQGW